MLIHFNQIEEKRIVNFRGGEKEVCTRMYTDEQNKIARFVLEPGASIGMHTHETNSETVYILEGKGKALYDDGEEELSAGNCHYCPKAMPTAL